MQGSGWVEGGEQVSGKEEFAGIDSNLGRVVTCCAGTAGAHWEGVRKETS